MDMNKDAVLGSEITALKTSIATVKAKIEDRGAMATPYGQCLSQLARVDLVMMENIKPFVKGRFADMIKLKEPQYTSVIESALGSKLFSIVVENTSTARILLSHNSF